LGQTKPVIYRVNDMKPNHPLKTKRLLRQSTGCLFYLVALCLTLFYPFNLNAQDVRLVKDIWSSSHPLNVLDPSQLTVIESKLYFVDGDKRLWVVDLLTGDAGPVPGWLNTKGRKIDNLIAFNGHLYFTSGIGSDYSILCQTNGYDTWEVESFKRTQIGRPSNFSVSENNLYFSAVSTSGGYEIWKTDGTISGTFYMDVNKGITGSEPKNIIEVNGITFFTADHFTPDVGRELWRTDWTPEGTFMVKDIWPYRSISSNPRNMVEFQGELVFVADSSGDFSQIWKSDGTEQGTQKIWSSRDITNISNGITDLYAFDSLLLFSGFSSTFGKELWVSDGTKDGSHMIDDYSAGKGHSSPYGFTQVGDKVFFKQHTPTTGVEIWVTDGTKQGTLLLKDIYPGPVSSLQLSNTPWVDFGNKLYFSALNQGMGEELWVSDGTPEGTRLVVNLSSPVEGSKPRSLCASSNGVLFVADNHRNEQVLMRTRGDSSSTQGLLGYSQISGSSFPHNLTLYDGSIYFMANDNVHGNELWTSMGDEASTKLVRDFNTQKDGNAEPEIMAIVNDRLLIQSRSTAQGFYQLRAQDKKGELSPPLIPLTSLVTAPKFRHIVSNGSQAFFDIKTYGKGNEVWVTDGTVEGTRLIKDIIHANGSIVIADMVAFKSGVLFVDLYRHRLWYSDGTALGTKLLQQLCFSPCVYTPTQLTVSGGYGYFVAQNIYGKELWRTDGTESGTSQFIDLAPGLGDADITALRAEQGHLFFIGYDGLGKSLYKSNGTPEGTAAIMRFDQHTPAIRTMEWLASTNDKLFYSVQLQSDEYQIWSLTKSDETFRRVSNLTSGLDSTSIHSAMAYGNDIYVFLKLPGRGFQLIVTDGTPERTELWGDDMVNQLSGPIDHMTAYKGGLYFSGTSPIYGNELFSLKLREHDISMSRFRVFPNPVSSRMRVGWLTPEAVYTGTYNYEILNSMGQTVVRGELNSLEESIDIDDLKQGMYVFHLEEYGYEKFIKTTLN